MCASSAVSSSFSFEYASLRYCTSLASLSVLAMTSLFCRIDEASGYPGGGLASPPGRRDGGTRLAAIGGAEAGQTGSCRQPEEGRRGQARQGSVRDAPGARRPQEGRRRGGEVVQRLREAEGGPPGRVRSVDGRRRDPGPDSGRSGEATGRREEGGAHAQAQGAAPERRGQARRAHACLVRGARPVSARACQRTLEFGLAHPRPTLDP